MQDWEEIRVRARDGVPYAVIARDLGISRSTVARAVRSDRPPVYERQVRVSKFEAFEGRVRALLAQCPDMPASVIGERVDWPFSDRALRENVARLRPEYAPSRLDPADRLDWEAGDVIQCDLCFPDVDIPIGGGQVGRFPVLVMVSAFSRYPVALMIPSRTSVDLVAGMWEAMKDFGAVPRRLLWDNEAGIGRGGKPVALMREFCGVLGMRLTQTRPYDPETKGIVERFNRYLQTSFLPGRAFACPEDFNDQLRTWLNGVRQKTPRAMDSSRAQAFAQERQKMKPLPPVEPMTGQRVETRLGRDYYVTIGGNSYSVDPSYIGSRISVVMDLTQVRIMLAGNVITTHQRCWAKNRNITDPAHQSIAQRLRHRASDAPTPSTDVEKRDLAVYDKLLGIEAA